MAVHLAVVAAMMVGKGKHMKTLTLILAAFMMLFCGTNAFALDIPSKPDNNWYIKDVAGKLSTSDIANLNNKIESFNKSTKNQIGVLIIPTLDGANIEDFSHDVFNSWGIGKAGLDNGILILIAANDHKMRIETGKGAEGDVPDLTTKQIMGDMKPYLRKNDYNGAVNVAVDSITHVMEDRTGQKAIVRTTIPGGQQTATHVSGGTIAVTFSMIVLFFGGVMLWLFVSHRRDEKRRRKLYDDTSIDIDQMKNYVPIAVATAIASSQERSYSLPSGSSSTKTSSSYGGSSSYDSGSSSSYDSSSSSGGGFDGGSSGGGGGSDSW